MASRRRRVLGIAFAHWLTTAGLLIFLAGQALAQDVTVCTDCHEDQKVQKESVHKDLACPDCHRGYREFPHPELAENQPSPTSRPQIVNMCARCHGDLKFVEDHRVPGRLLPLINYQQSIHGKAVAGGNLKAAICTDCHSSHDILGPSDPRSKVSRANTPVTCGQCHATELTQYQRSVHGRAQAQGKSGVPTCTDCHGIHSIEHADQAAKSDAERALGKASCSRCHDSEVLSREYALPMDRVRSYLDSYHGLAVKRGSPVVANCASCHAVHEILASSDPASSVNPVNLPATCGKCHPGASANFARGAVHQTSGAGGAAIYWVSTAYIALIIVVIGAMLIHNAFDFRAKLNGARSQHVEGFFTRGEVAQHALLMTSFAVLVLSGFALKWPDSLFGVLIPVSENLRRAIHRVAGASMIALTIYHVIHLALSARGHAFLRKFRPRLQDVRLALQNLAFNTRRRNAPADLTYPSYIEKVEYWALIWGAVIMGVTGLLLWFENITLRLFPLWVMNLLTVIHYYEAVLATLAILVWHIYFVVLDPSIYPLRSLKRVKSPQE